MHTFQFDLHSHTPKRLKLIQLVISNLHSNIFISSLFILGGKFFFSTADCYASIRIKYHVWKKKYRYHACYFPYMNYPRRISTSLFVGGFSLSLYQSQPYSFMKKMFKWVTLLGEKILGSLEVEWSWRDLKRDDVLSRKAKENERSISVDLTNAVLSSTNDVNAIADFVLGSILFAICKAFFFQCGWLISKSFRLNFL